MQSMRGAWVLFFLVFPAGVFASPITLPPNWVKNVQELHLPNGMKFLLYARGEAPIFSAFIRFRVGGIDEEPGKTGLAHFLEHMAFKGTRTIGTSDFEKEKPILEEIERVGAELSREYAKGIQADRKRILDLREELRRLHEEEEKYLVKEELAKRMLENGGTDYNATTSKDMTSYFVSLPSEKLAFWADLESQRIFEPVFREFYEEKEVVLEERRMRVDDDPDGQLYEEFLQNAFVKSPYRWPTLGFQEDLLSLTLDDLERFWSRFYRPSEAIGVLIGRFDLDEAERILKETFGKIPAGSDGPPGRSYPKEPAQKGGRQFTLRRSARPRIVIGYHKPTLPDRDDYIFDVLNEIMGEGRSSRLYQRLVLEKKIAAHVETSTGAPGSRLPNLFMIEATPLGKHSPEELLKGIEEEIVKVQKEGVSSRELEKARNRLAVDLLWRMKTNEGLASQLSYFEIAAGDWRYTATYLDQINQFQPEDLQRVANQYLQTNNRTVAILKP